MNPGSEAQIQQTRVGTPSGERLLRRRAVWRVTFVLGLLGGLGLFLLS